METIQETVADQIGENNVKNNDLGAASKVANGAAIKRM